MLMGLVWSNEASRAKRGKKPVLTLLREDEYPECVHDKSAGISVSQLTASSAQTCISSVKWDSSTFL